MSAFRLSMTVATPAVRDAASPTMRCRTTNHLGVLLAAGLVGLAACSDEPFPTDPSQLDPGGPSANRAEGDAPEVRPHEAAFHEVSAQIKGFGGYSYDEKGNLVAYLVDPAGEERAARQLLEPILKARDLSRRDRSTGEILIRRGEYSFPELSEWRDRATQPLLELGGVEWTDLDEAQNRFVVGLSRSAVREEAVKVLQEHDVPAKAVVFEESSRAVEDLDLKDYFRPLRGGFQIQRAGGGTCTLGFNAFRNGTRAFLTNSHCTLKVWQSNATWIYQNNSSSSAKLAGVEIYDPAPFSCYWFSKCRWSDAAVIGKLSNVSWNHGRIARTTFWGYGPGNSGSTTVNPNNPFMTIIGEYSFPIGGEMFDKMGRTTGWTYGFVKKTCVDMKKSSYPGGLGIILCQDWANYHRAGGDSGSPVFRWYGNTVRLAGIHWGGITQNGTTYGILSAMWNIEKDLGALSTS